MWISAGDHELTENIVHLVLAKIPGGPPGVKGISLFAVPKFLPDGQRNDIALAGLNHKMGFRGTTRTQGRPADTRDPAAPPVPIIEHADVRRMLLAQKCYAEGALAFVLYCGLL